MSTHANSAFSIKNWDEQAYNEVDDQLKLTRATVAYAYSGDVEGESAVEYLMMYRGDGSATAIGLERVRGRLNGKSGTFLLEYRGGFADGSATMDCDVVAGSGRGELSGLRGRGRAISKSDGSTSLSLEYDLDQ